MNQDQKNELARQLGIDPATQFILDEGSNHQYDCKCDTCKAWWQKMGPNPDTLDFGPFTLEEIGWTPEQLQQWKDVINDESE